VIQALAERSPVPLSVDTSKAEVARACLAAGAAIINDVTALGDPEMTGAVRSGGAGVILMHMQGTPQTMQQNPQYDDVVGEIVHFFEGRLARLGSAGIVPEQVAIDPGIGFGKTSAHNAEILGHLGAFQCLGRPLCLGVSRKGFLGRIAGNRPVERRLPGSLAALLYAQSQHAVQIVRVHDVEETRDALVVFDAIEQAGQAAQGPEQSAEYSG
jgi:dihydropteroate synthase